MTRQQKPLKKKNQKIILTDTGKALAVGLTSVCFVLSVFTGTVGAVSAEENNQANLTYEEIAQSLKADGLLEGTDKVKVYNANRLPIKNLFNHREFKEVYYLIVESLEHIPTIEKVFDFHGIRTPWEHSGLSYETGLYYWSHCDDEWHHWQTEMQSLTALGNYFQQFEEEENS